MSYTEEDVLGIAKKVLGLLLAIVLIICLVSCAGKKTVTASVTFEGIDDFTIVTSANNFVNMSRVDNTMKVTMNQNGVYPFLISAGDSNQYSFLLTYDRGAVSAEADDGLSYVIRTN